MERPEGQMMAVKKRRGRQSREERLRAWVAALASHTAAAAVVIAQLVDALARAHLARLTQYR